MKKPKTFFLFRPVNLYDVVFVKKKKKTRNIFDLNCSGERSDRFYSILADVT